MTDPIPFPPSSQRAADELDEAEKIRRQLDEAERLARLTPGEWELWIDKSAAQLGIPRATLEKSVKAIIARNEKDKRERKTEEERERRRAENAAKDKRREQAKRKEQEFKVLAELPEHEQDARLDALAERLQEDPATIREEFATSSSPPVDSEPELWPEAVATTQLLDDMAKQIQRYVYIRPEELVAAVLYAAMCWVHNATHSPLLGVTAADIDAGKTLLLGVLHWLVPKPRRSAELTGPATYRIIDRERPTLIMDEIEDIFQRRKDLAHIINHSWTRGAVVTRCLPGQQGEHDYSIFCPKILGGLLANLPRATDSRLIRIKMWPKLEEVVEDFRYTDTPEAAELRRRLARWAADNAVALGEAKPAPPDGFNNRLMENWKLLLAIADLAGGAWPERARQAAVKLARQNAMPSQGRRLLAALRDIFANRDQIPSAETIQLLAADPDAEWCEYGRGRAPITQRQLAALLREYEVYPVVLHPTGRSDLSRHGYRRAQFKDAWARFLQSDPNIRTPPPRPKRK